MGNAESAEEKTSDNFLHGDKNRDSDGEENRDYFNEAVETGEQILERQIKEQEK